MSTLRRVSASRLNSIDQCTMKFYMGEVLGLPEKVWPRTHAGTIVHSVLECLCRDKHRHHHDAVVAAQSVYASTAIGRLIRTWQYKTKVGDDIIADVDNMCMVAINHTNFLDEGAIRRFEPEHEFKMTLENGVVVKGFIDRLCQMPDRWIVHDYKTARQKATKAEVRDSYQSLTYQLYLWKTYGALAECRYYFLRHGPTKMTPQKHVMVTPAATPEQLAGFEKYLEHMGKMVNSFGIEEAHSGFCTDSGFCEKVCSYRRPLNYWAVVDKTSGQTVATYMLDNRPQISDNQILEERSHNGCPKFN